MKLAAGLLDSPWWAEWDGYVVGTPFWLATAPLEGLNPLESWRGDLAIWTAVVFLVLLVILWKYAWGPIVRALQSREQAIADQIAQAQRQQQQAQALLAEYQQKLAQSQQEIHQMLEEARRQAEQISRQILQQAHQQAEADRLKMLQDIQRAKQQAFRELSTQAVGLVVQLASKILQTELRPESHRQLIQQALTQWEAIPPNGGLFSPLPGPSASLPSSGPKSLQPSKGDSLSRQKESRG
ncbi:MAG: F0F1 ATP synthase subunit B [Thermoguttaceae bacterium]|nr:F0F1 ATP synthase subunit B [Thermoguttaceae bacterium]MDW8039395.1 F0F1 ATP synthase subunit B [Thermoguttaceae bacterium]